MPDGRNTIVLLLLAQLRTGKAKPFRGDLPVSWGISWTLCSYSNPLQAVRLRRSIALNNNDRSALRRRQLRRSHPVQVLAAPARPGCLVAHRYNSKGGIWADITDDAIDSWPGW